MHGGGQRAFLQVVKRYAKRGYAALSVNWGGRPMEDAQADDPNTNWGAVDPTQNNAGGYSNLLPQDNTIDPFPSARNNNRRLAVPLVVSTTPNFSKRSMLLPCSGTSQNPGVARRSTHLC